MKLKEINLMITSIGRRVHLQSAIKNAMAIAGYSGRIITTDCSWSAPGLQFSDRGYEVPQSTDSNYTGALLDIIQSERIGFVFPSSDVDLLVLARARDILEQYTVILLAPLYDDVIKCADKMESERLFGELGLRSPKIFADYDSIKSGDFPLVVKGRGRETATTKGFHKVVDEQELSYCLEHTADPIIQEFIEGPEFTVDVLADLQGNPISVVPRRRLSIRAFVTDKGVTVDDESIIQEAVRIVDEIKPKGFCNIQCVKKGSHNYWIEINPRISGGFALFFASCSKVAFLFLDILSGKIANNIIGDYQVGCHLAKYDEVVVSNSEKRVAPVDIFSHRNWGIGR